MIEVIIMYVVLIGQLYVLSYYYPNKFITRIGYVLDNYPASEYPKLYPAQASEEKARKGLRIYKIMTRSTLILGIILLILATVDGMVISGNIKDSMVTLFAMVQFIPFILLEVSELKHYKLMRENNKTVKRSANLTPRRYFDYAAPVKFFGALTLFILYFAFNLYRMDFALSWGASGLTTLITILGVHLYFAVVVIWIMYGKKLDPHQSHKDRDILISSVVNTTLNISMTVSSFLLIYGALQHYSLDQYEAMALSIYFQLCAYFGPGTMLKTTNVENINFEVYKKNTNFS